MDVAPRLTCDMDYKVCTDLGSHSANVYAGAYLYAWEQSNCFCVTLYRTRAFNSLYVVLDLHASQTLKIQNTRQNEHPITHLWEVQIQDQKIRIRSFVAKLVGYMPYFNQAVYKSQPKKSLVVLQYLIILILSLCRFSYFKGCSQLQSFPLLRPASPVKKPKTTLLDKILVLLTNFRMCNLMVHPFKKAILNGQYICTNRCIKYVSKSNCPY